MYGEDSARIRLGDWEGTQRFVISDKVTRHEKVLSRDFLQENECLVDHGSDTIVIGG